MTVIRCQKKYCKWNELGECRKQLVHIVEMQLGTSFYLTKEQKTVYAPVCGDMEILGSEA